jgi:predicted nucleic acid-binding protein
MKVFLDTNVLVAACLADHEHHARAIPIVQHVHQGKLQGFVSGHSLLEMHSVLTRLPRAPRILPVQAASLIADNVAKRFSVISLTSKEYAELCTALGKSGVTGGKSFDALHLACAEKSGAERIYTFNVQHFRELAGHLENRITAP